MKEFKFDGSKGNVNVDMTYTAPKSRTRNTIGKTFLLFGMASMAMHGMSAIGNSMHHNIDLTPVSSIETTISQPSNVNQILQDNTVQIINYHSNQSGQIDHVNVGAGAVIHDSATKESKGSNAILTLGSLVKQSDGWQTKVFYHGQEIKAQVEVLTNGLQNQGYQEVFQNIATISLHCSDAQSSALYNSISGFNMAGTVSQNSMSIHAENSAQILPGSPIVDANGHLLGLDSTNRPDLSLYSSYTNATYNNSETMGQNLSHWMHGNNLTQDTGHNNIATSPYARVGDANGRISDPTKGVDTNYIPNGLGNATHNMNTIGDEGFTPQAVHVYGINGQNITAQATHLHQSLDDISNQVSKTPSMEF